MISVTLCQSGCKSSNQQGRPRSRNGRGRRQVQPWLGVPLIGGQKSETKTGILIEPDVNVQVRTVHDLSPENLKGNTRRKARSGVLEKTGFKSQLYYLINGLGQAT